MELDGSVSHVAKVLHAVEVDVCNIASATLQVQQSPIRKGVKCLCSRK